MGVYDPRKCVTTYNSVPLSGFGTGTFIKATRRKPLANLEELGADGEGAFVLTGDHSYDIEITLKKASPSNTLLAQFARATAMGAPVIGPLSILDLATNARFDAEEVMVTMSPDFERSGGDTYGENVWKLVAKKGAEDQRGFAS